MATYQLTVRVPGSGDLLLDRISAVRQILQRWQGQDEVRLAVLRDKQEVFEPLPYRVAYGPILASELADLLGDGCLVVRRTVP